jgi:hypothetical protein
MKKVRPVWCVCCGGSVCCCAKGGRVLAPPPPGLEAWCPAATPVVAEQAGARVESDGTTRGTAARPGSTRPATETLGNVQVAARHHGSCQRWCGNAVWASGPIRSAASKGVAREVGGEGAGPAWTGWRGATHRLAQLGRTGSPGRGLGITLRGRAGQGGHRWQEQHGVRGRDAGEKDE